MQNYYKYTKLKGLRVFLKVNNYHLKFLNELCENFKFSMHERASGKGPTTVKISCTQINSPIVYLGINEN